MSKAEDQFPTFPLKKNTDILWELLTYTKLLSLRTMLYLEVFELCFLIFFFYKGIICFFSLFQVENDLPQRPTDFPCGLWLYPFHLLHCRRPESHRYCFTIAEPKVSTTAAQTNDTR